MYINFIYIYNFLFILTEIRGESSDCIIIHAMRLLCLYQRPHIISSLGWASKSCKMSSCASVEFMLFFSTFFRKVVLLTASTQRGSYHCCASGLTFVNCVCVDVEDQLSGTLWCLRRNLQTFLPDVKKTPWPEGGALFNLYFSEVVQQEFPKQVKHQT